MSRRPVLPVAVAIALLSAAPAAAQQHDHGGLDGSGHEHGAGQGPEQGAPTIHAGPASPPRGPTPAAPLPPAAHSHPAAGGELARLLDEARPGDHVRVPPGVHVGNFTVATPVVLEGDGEAVLDGGGSGTVLTVTAPGTVVRGLRLRGSGDGPHGTPAGIVVTADEVTVEDNVVEDVYHGVMVKDADDIRIVGNSIRGRQGRLGSDGHALGEDPHAAHADAEGRSGYERGDGISLHNVKAALVRGNSVDQSRDGMYLSFADSVLLDENHVGGSRYGVHSMFSHDLSIVGNHMEGNLSGLVLMYGGPALVLRNALLDNQSPSTGFGILLKDVVAAHVAENVLARNRVGLHVDGPAGAAERLRVVRNTVAANQVGIVLYPSASGIFAVNSFVQNVVQVLGMGHGVVDRNEWSDQGSGNHWSSYRGYDASGSGIGTIPHVEGGRIEAALRKAPPLLALASTPAVRLLRQVEERWGAAASPVAVDPLPLMAPHSAALPPPPEEPAVQLLVAASGAAAVLAAAAVLMIGRKRSVRERRGPIRRLRDAHA